MSDHAVSLSSNTYTNTHWSKHGEETSEKCLYYNDEIDCCKEGVIKYSQTSWYEGLTTVDNCFIEVAVKVRKLR